MDLQVTQGTALAASPDLLDPNFMHRVVLMGQHGDEGAYGLVINHASKQKTHTVFPEHPTLSQVEFPVYVGGPVELSALQILHCVPDAIPGGIPIQKDLYIGGDLDAVGEYILQDPDKARHEVRLIVGYSGWGAGQLEHELSTGSWLPVAMTSEELFRMEPEQLWRHLVRSLGEGHQDLEYQPPDPNWN